eukprot:TRINITY_DN29744_c0_g1_i1.p1 TRINITY_DN29744_c0_g1~~TRINITY_DN29744_c0_g1_i1.p1  ORF type:complete len:1528 (+),score=380.85 TRINITY_DN29744_c0_g1_i1:269-4852(+)
MKKVKYASALVSNAKDAGKKGKGTKVAFEVDDDGYSSGSGDDGEGSRAPAGFQLSLDNFGAAAGSFGQKEEKGAEFGAKKGDDRQKLWKNAQLNVSQKRAVFAFARGAFVGRRTSHGSRVARGSVHKQVRDSVLGQDLPRDSVAETHNGLTSRHSAAADSLPRTSIRGVHSTAGRRPSIPHELHEAGGSVHSDTAGGKHASTHSRGSRFARHSQAAQQMSGAVAEAVRHAEKKLPHYKKGEESARQRDSIVKNIARMRGSQRASCLESMILMRKQQEQDKKGKEAYAGAAKRSSDVSHHDEHHTEEAPKAITADDEDGLSDGSDEGLLDPEDGQGKSADAACPVASLSNRLNALFEPTTELQRTLNDNSKRRDERRREEEKRKEEAKRVSSLQGDIAKRIEEATRSGRKLKTALNAVFKGIKKVHMAERVQLGLASKWKEKYRIRILAIFHDTAKLFAKPSNDVADIVLADWVELMEQLDKEILNRQGKPSDASDIRGLANTGLKICETLQEAYVTADRMHQLILHLHEQSKTGDMVKAVNVSIKQSIIAKTTIEVLLRRFQDLAKEGNLWSRPYAECGHQMMKTQIEGAKNCTSCQALVGFNHEWTCFQCKVYLCGFCGNNRTLREQMRLIVDASGWHQAIWKTYAYELTSWVCKAQQSLREMTWMEAIAKRGEYLDRWMTMASLEKEYFIVQMWKRLTWEPREPTWVVVTSLHPSTSPDNLAWFMKEHVGDFESCVVHMDPVTGASLRVGYVDFDDPLLAKKCAEHCHLRKFQGSRIKVHLGPPVMPQKRRKKRMTLWELSQQGEDSQASIRCFAMDAVGLTLLEMDEVCTNSLDGVVGVDMVRVADKDEMCGVIIFESPEAAQAADKAIDAGLPGITANAKMPMGVQATCLETPPEYRSKYEEAYLKSAMMGRITEALRSYGFSEEEIARLEVALSGSQTFFNVDISDKDDVETLQAAIMAEMHACGLAVTPQLKRHLNGIIAAACALEAAKAGDSHRGPLPGREQGGAIMADWLGQQVSLTEEKLLEMLEEAPFVESQQSAWSQLRGKGMRSKLKAATWVSQLCQRLHEEEDAKLDKARLGKRHAVPDVPSFLQLTNRCLMLVSEMKKGEDSSPGRFSYASSAEMSWTKMDLDGTDTAVFDPLALAQHAYGRQGLRDAMTLDLSEVMRLGQGPGSAAGPEDATIHTLVEQLKRKVLQNFSGARDQRLEILIMWSDCMWAWAAKLLLLDVFKRWVYCLTPGLRQGSAPPPRVRDVVSQHRKEAAAWEAQQLLGKMVPPFSSPPRADEPCAPEQRMQRVFVQPAPPRDGPGSLDLQVWQRTAAQLRRNARKHAEVVSGREQEKMTSRPPGDSGPQEDPAPAESALDLAIAKESVDEPIMEADLAKGSPTRPLSQQSTVANSPVPRGATASSTLSSWPRTSPVPRMPSPCGTRPRTGDYWTHERIHDLSHQMRPSPPPLLPVERHMRSPPLHPRPPEKEIVPTPRPRRRMITQSYVPEEKDVHIPDEVPKTFEDDVLTDPFGMRDW